MTDISAAMSTYSCVKIMKLCYRHFYDTLRWPFDPFPNRQRQVTLKLEGGTGEIMETSSVHRRTTRVTRKDCLNFLVGFMGVLVLAVTIGNGLWAYIGGDSAVVD